MRHLVDAHLSEGGLQDLVVVHCIILCGSIEVHLHGTMLLKASTRKSLQDSTAQKEDESCMWSIFCSS